ncbi:MAG: primosomal protein N' [Lachnospiraceae bacterium]|nr:primosomal protein N' [Lachnospiraceae bacterium]
MLLASVVIDINSKEVDRPFTYIVPDAFSGQVRTGSAVVVPFGRGNTRRRGYVTQLFEGKETPERPLKEILSPDEKALSHTEQLVRLAVFLRERYGGTLYQCLSTVLPGKTEVKARKPRVFEFLCDESRRREEYETAVKKKYYARMRLLEAFQDRRVLPASIVTDRLTITASTLKYFTDHGLLRIREAEDTAGLSGTAAGKPRPVLNREQQEAVEGIINDPRPVHLLFGITGSGKTEVYLSLIEKVLSEGKEAIVLIPEIALTYQTVMRFYERFGDVVSVVHSRLSKGEKIERFKKAEDGELKVMIGPRSALFTPFKELGLIVIDEFHESSYLSDQTPRYSTVETAAERASYTGAKVVLGSATPSVEVFYEAEQGRYGLHRLNTRAVPGSMLPEVLVLDMRKELSSGNRSAFSGALRERILDRLVKKEQIMLFLNRRGYSGAVSCRMCGKPVSCPHCSVALKYHADGSLRCHICGFRRPMVKECPECGSKLIGSFGIGTEKVEALVQQEFPGARTLRMDADTTGGKEGHREILERFMNHEADVLIGTQMIVKGHDFPDVTLVGVIAADLSLLVPDFRSAERTFQLLTQAEGRAGRAKKPGECVIQTYMPEHYAVQAAAAQDYELFYRNELLYRQQLSYPPAGYLMKLVVSGQDASAVKAVMATVAAAAKARFHDAAEFLGPSEASIYRVKDTFREVLHFKTKTLSALLGVKAALEALAEKETEGRRLFYSFES